jgi:hypothetical protein
MKTMPLLLLTCLTGSTLWSAVTIEEKDVAPLIGPRQPSSMTTPKRLEIGAIPARLKVEQVRRLQDGRNESNNQIDNERTTRPSQIPPRTPPSRTKTFWG